MWNHGRSPYTVGVQHYPERCHCVHTLLPDVLKGVQPAIYVGHVGHNNKNDVETERSMKAET